MVTVSRGSRYPGEDVRPTSRKEIYGWMAYGLAAEVFAICGTGAYLPTPKDKTVMTATNNRRLFPTRNFGAIGSGDGCAQIRS